MNASGRLQRKYAAWIGGYVVAALLLAGGMEAWFGYRENREAASARATEKAQATAALVAGHVQGIVRQLEWMTLPTRETGAAALAQRRFEMRNLLKEVAAITDIRQVDRGGHEQLFVSRVEADTVASRRDHSGDAGFIAARAGAVHFGTVAYRKGSEPYARVALPPRPGSDWVTLADISLRHVWDRIASMTVGRTGYAYVVDDRGRLIAHPDLNLVLKVSDLSALPQWRATDAAVTARSHDGTPVIAAAARVPALGWTVVVEQPVAEAFAAVEASLARLALIAGCAFVLATLGAVVLARKLVAPVEALERGARALASGQMGHRVDVRSGDAFGLLAGQFNAMAASLGRSQEELERQVADRTRELSSAIRAKSRFLAAASHDLRQPMHALGLFIAQLRAKPQLPAHRELVDRIDRAAQATGSLLDALLDISRLDAQAVSPEPTEFALGPLFQRLAGEFEPVAHNKGLALHIVSSRAWVRTDPLLLERILRNLLANAIRYTRRGRVVLGGRHRGGDLRVDVIDTGIGIAATERDAIFEEFYQCASALGDRGQGLGLGLAIVRRLAQLLDLPLEFVSRPGRGSRFSVTVATCEPREADSATLFIDTGIAAGALVVVIDDDALAREAMAGLLQDWGCEVVTARSGDQALARLASRMPQLAVCDFQLGDGHTGLQAIARLHAACGAPVPAFLVTGDTSPAMRATVEAAGYAWLSKPVAPLRLRALVSRLLRAPSPAVGALRLPA